MVHEDCTAAPSTEIAHFGVCVLMACTWQRGSTCESEILQSSGRADCLEECSAGGCFVHMLTAIVW